MSAALIPQGERAPNLTEASRARILAERAADTLAATAILVAMVTVTPVPIAVGTPAAVVGAIRAAREAERAMGSREANKAITFALADDL